MWRCDDLVAAAAAALRARSDALDLEQSVRGLDALAELELHSILRSGLAQAGWSVLAEQPYPGQPGERPAFRARERCDLVILPEGVGAAVGLADPVHAVLEADAQAATLFAAVAMPKPVVGVPPEDAFWLEVKSVGQFAFIGGVPTANGAYASELVRGPALDAAKLSKDRRISHAGVLLVLLTADERTAAHDLGVMVHRCLDRDLPVCDPVTERFGITDRIGNQVCSVSLIRVRSE